MKEKGICQVNVRARIGRYDKCRNNIFSPLTLYRGRDTLKVRPFKKEMSQRSDLEKGSKIETTSTKYKASSKPKKQF